jgi:hypothetical protein
MLARRFSIICVLTALFGMGFASLVAHSEHSERRGSFSCSLGHPCK